VLASIFGSHFASISCVVVGRDVGLKTACCMLDTKSASDGSV